MEIWSCDFLLMLITNTRSWRLLFIFFLQHSVWIVARWELPIITLCMGSDNSPLPMSCVGQTSIDGSSKFFVDFCKHMTVNTSYPFWIATMFLPTNCECMIWYCFHKSSDKADYWGQCKCAAKSVEECEYLLTMPCYYDDLWDAW